MRFLTRFLTIVLLVVLVSWAIWLAKRVRYWMGILTGRPARPAAEKPEMALRRDPVCGMFVSPEISFTLEQSGQVHHFCSAECRERFKSKLPRAANG